MGSGPGRTGRDHMCGACYVPARVAGSRASAAVGIGEALVRVQSVLAGRGRTGAASMARQPDTTARVAKSRRH